MYKEYRNNATKANDVMTTSSWMKEEEPGEGIDKEINEIELEPVERQRSMESGHRKTSKNGLYRHEQTLKNLNIYRKTIYNSHLFCSVS